MYFSLSSPFTGHNRIVLLPSFSPFLNICHRGCILEAAVSISFVFPSLLWVFFAAVEGWRGCKVMLVDGILSPCGCFGKSQMEVVDGGNMWVLAAITAEALSSWGAFGSLQQFWRRTVVVLPVCDQLE